ncbi:MAG: hypothetical protein NTX13_10720 [Acidobacteria bacterium]|nr:hypothetical protein [Acidobacteriota bacterium]
MKTKTKIAIFACTAGVAAFFAIDFCNLVYQCGCQGMLGTGAAHCNVHDHLAAKHCPWCTHGGVGFVAAMTPVFATQGWLAFTRRPFGSRQRLLGGWLAFPVLGGIGALLVGLSQGYWP